MGEKLHVAGREVAEGEGKPPDDTDMAAWTPLNVCVVLVFATVCLLVLHWAGVIG